MRWALYLQEHPGECLPRRDFQLNLTTTGRVTAPLLQGGQQWQTMDLLSGSDITFDIVGLETTVDTTDVLDLPGAFNSSDEELNTIWGLGATAASVACVEEGSQGPVWEIDQNKGALVRSTRASETLNDSNFANYTLDFDVMINRGGLWWSVAAS